MKKLLRDNKTEQLNRNEASRNFDELPTERQALIEEIQQDIEAEISWNEEYATENSDNPISEFVQSFGYGESDTGAIIDRTNDHEWREFPLAVKKIQENEKSMTRKDFFEWIAEYCTLETSKGIGRVYFSVYSMEIGEIEIQLDEKITTKIGELSDDERAILYSLASINSDTWVFGDASYDYWVMVFDADQLETELLDAEEKLLDAETVKILSIDAWSESDHDENIHWTWNGWHTAGELSRAEFDALDTDQQKISYMVDNGFLVAGCEKLISVDDDGFNIVFCDKENHEQPIFAIEYGGQE